MSSLNECVSFKLYPSTSSTPTSLFNLMLLNGFLIRISAGISHTYYTYDTMKLSLFPLSISYSQIFSVPFRGEHSQKSHMSLEIKPQLCLLYAIKELESEKLQLLNGDVKFHSSKAFKRCSMLPGLCHLTHGEMWYTTLHQWHTETVTQSHILFWECTAFPQSANRFFGEDRVQSADTQIPHGWRYPFLRREWNENAHWL